MSSPCSSWSCSHSLSTGRHYKPAQPLYHALFNKQAITDEKSTQSARYILSRFLAPRSTQSLLSWLKVTYTSITVWLAQSPLKTNDSFSRFAPLKASQTNRTETPTPCTSFVAKGVLQTNYSHKVALFTHRGDIFLRIFVSSVSDK